MSAAASSVVVLKVFDKDIMNTADYIGQGSIPLADVLSSAGCKLQRNVHLCDRSGTPIKGARAGDQPRILVTVEVFYNEDVSTIVREHIVHEYRLSVIIIMIRTVD